MYKYFLEYQIYKKFKF